MTPRRPRPHRRVTVGRSLSARLSFAVVASLLAASAGAGCGSANTSVVEVTVSGLVAGIDHLQVTGTLGTSVLDATVKGTTTPIPTTPAFTFTISIDQSRSGSLVFTVDADDASGKVLATGGQTATVTTGQVTMASVTLVAAATTYPIAFAAPVSYGSTDGVALASADLDLDGHLDVAVLAGRALYLYHGVGDGTLSTTATTLQLSGTSLALLNLDRDAAGLLDVVVADSGEIAVKSVINQSTSGSFQFSVSTPTTVVGVTCCVSGLAVGDIDGDRNADVAALGGGDNKVYYLIGQSGGTLLSQSGVDVTGGGGSEWDSGTLAGSVSTVSLADVDGDGQDDLLTASSVTSSGGTTTFQVSVQRAADRSVGDFYGAARTYAVPIEGPVIVADIDGLHGPDVISGHSLLLNAGDGTFGGAPLPLGLEVADAVADLNGDGKLDLIGTGSSGTLTILVGNGDGTFTVLATTFPQTPDQLAVADLNGDRKPDLLLLNNGQLQVLLAQ